MKVLHSVCQQICKTQQWPQDWKRSGIITVPKKGNARECSNCNTTALISHASKVMLKILQASLQQFMNQEIPDAQAGFESQRNQRWNCQHVLDHRKSKRVPLKTSTSASLTKVFDGVDHNKLKKIPKEIGIPDYLICLLKGFTNLHAGQETTVRNRHGTMNWFQTRKGVHQGCILSPCFFNLNAE